MKREYWNRVAEDYREEIFEVSREDRKGIVAAAIKKYGGMSKAATDFGCGIGNFLPELSTAFEKVLAVDISGKCIKQAKSNYAELSNVDYRTADLSSSDTRLPKVDFALAVNSVITSSLSVREGMLDKACSHLKPNGHLVLVVPSLESFLFSNFRLIEWNLKEGVSASHAGRAGFDSHQDGTRLREGLAPIDGVLTKHYLEEELEVLMSKRGMNVLDIEKVEYSWKTEFTEPPHWMKDPFPWDWICIARR